MSEHFLRSKAQKQNPWMLLQLIGVPISAIFFLPPFSLVPHLLQKIQEEQVEALILATHWPTQPLVQSNFELSCTRASGVQTQCNKFGITTRLASWRPGTLKNYLKYIDLWKEIVSMNSFHIFSKSVQNILDFFSKLFSNGHNYSQINAVSSTLSSIITINKVPCQKYADVKKFMKVNFELQLTFPKYYDMGC